ncbi:MAG: hypothetical protein HYZ28_19755 [Myxococcales bacterium]|nr:hypothetical protein [Myxococcales bacterium]
MSDGLSGRGAMELPGLGKRRMGTAPSERRRSSGQGQPKYGPDFSSSREVFTWVGAGR